MSGIRECLALTLLGLLTKPEPTTTHLCQERHRKGLAIRRGHGSNTAYCVRYVLWEFQVILKPSVCEEYLGFRRRLAFVMRLNSKKLAFVMRLNSKNGCSEQRR